MLRLAAFCEQFTPLVALDPPCGLMLDATGCAHLFGGDAAMRTSVLQALAHLSFTGRAAVAGTPDAARALARFGETAVRCPAKMKISPGRSPSPRSKRHERRASR
ncbi:MAG: hypothetical protein U1E25_07180 [Methylocystis sp.]